MMSFILTALVAFAFGLWFGVIGTITYLDYRNHLRRATPCQNPKQIQLIYTSVDASGKHE